jgi:D-alanyl-D-alanine carboxypeptidase
MRFVILFALSVCSSGLGQSLPGCDYADLATFHQAYDTWQYTLLDPLYKLPESYVPPDLFVIAQQSSTYKARSLLRADLEALLHDAALAGAALEIQSAYRSYSYQAQTFQYWVDKEGKTAALKTSARAGHSEHQLGTALDFRSKDGPAPWDLEDWATTPAGVWLAENAWRYGFVMSYPKGKEALTCYSYEPWHYRYMGRELAKAIKESGLTLREWLWLNQ